MRAGYRTESWGSRGLEGIAAEWRELLARSDADPLFNSPEWLTGWWQHYQPVVHGELRVAAALDGESLQGLAILYQREARHRLGLRGVRLELCGNAWRVGGAAMSERTGLLLDRRETPAAMEALAEHLLADDSWDDLLAAHTLQDGPTARTFRMMAERCGGYLRQVDRLDAWEIPLQGGFDGFVERLGAGTRARILGSRQRLAQAGALRERVLGPDELEEGWEIFARLYELRWHRRFSAHLRAFYGAMATQLTARGVPALSVLEFDGEPVSMLVNFRAAGREYTMVSAFAPVGVKRVSPGWLHLGLAIERACNDGLQCFDLLGGEGKQEQYKASLGGEHSQLVCLQLVRNRRLATIYRTWDRLVRGRSSAGIAPAASA